MKNPTMVIVHRLTNRLRVKLSHPLKNILESKDMIKEHKGIKFVKYNSITKSLLINFDEFEIKSEEVLIRIAIVYSKSYGYNPINIVSNCPKREMPMLSYYSIAAILGATLSKFILWPKNVQEFLNWIAVGTTIGAIGEHAYSEINEKGTVDPEVMSVMYLVNSIRKGNFIAPSAVTWLTTFGRHILNTSYDEIILKVDEIRNVCSGETYYNVSVFPAIDNNEKIGFLKTFISRFIESEKINMGKSILVTKTGINNNGRAYFGFSNGYNAIRMKDGSEHIIGNVIS
ncbi:hypothetical protein [Clostridium fallax]|uniref:Uncharacterized protein n=1 Tax=Clostridium fallax TaxID=1533 RepID=A0A1M4XA72_9CLOT|nr:hypothetical protein [Clostridium fallax]SHE90408.1 hypothetical protein SAMN05443638_1172 [Clostridium fallax]SQB06010.1 Uncharacterised protein [Clostridium fallax]